MLSINSEYSLYGKSVLVGILGSSFLVLFYWLIIFLVSGDPGHPLQQFLVYKYWMSSLFLGFGAQTGLFWLVRRKKMGNKKMGATVALGGGTGAGSMVLCCAHHIADVLPLMGLSAAALFLSKYQILFFSVGIISNLGGIVYMIHILKKLK